MGLCWLFFWGWGNGGAVLFLGEGDGTLGDGGVIGGVEEDGFAREGLLGFYGRKTDVVVEGIKVTDIALFEVGRKEREKRFFVLGITGAEADDSTDVCEEDTNHLLVFLLGSRLFGHGEEELIFS